MNKKFVHLAFVCKDSLANRPYRSPLLQTHCVVWNWPNFIHLLHNCIAKSNSGFHNESPSDDSIISVLDVSGREIHFFLKKKLYANYEFVWNWFQCLWYCYDSDVRLLVRSDIFFFSLWGEICKCYNDFLNSIISVELFVLIDRIWIHMCVFIWLS